MKTCHNCGFEMADNMNFCPQCHAKYEPPEPPSRVDGATRKCGKLKIAASIALGVISILCFYSTKYLQQRSRIAALSELLMDKYKFPKDGFEVRHLDGNRYGVFFFVTYCGKTKTLNGDTPSLVMVADEKKRTFNFASREDSRNAEHLKTLFVSRLSKDREIDFSENDLVL